MWVHVCEEYNSTSAVSCNGLDFTGQVALSIIPYLISANVNSGGGGRG